VLNDNGTIVHELCECSSRDKPVDEAIRTPRHTDEVVVLVLASQSRISDLLKREGFSVENLTSHRFDPICRSYATDDAGPVAIPARRAIASNRLSPSFPLVRGASKRTKLRGLSGGHSATCRKLARSSARASISSSANSISDASAIVLGFAAMRMSPAHLRAGNWLAAEVVVNAADDREERGHVSAGI
jgi:hypothetical protein